MPLTRVSKENFNKEVICNAVCKEMLNLKEEYWISYYNTKAPNGYNLSDGGTGGALHNKPFSKASRLKISKRRIGTHHSEDTKKKIGDGNRGNKNGMLGKKRPDISERNRKGKGKKRPEHSKWMKQNYQNRPEIKKSLIEIQKGSKLVNGHWVRINA